MGVLAVELLLKGVSNVVICEVDGAIKPVEINFALILDRMYKGKLKDGDLDMFTATQIEEMRLICQKRSFNIQNLYNISRDICK